jgi:hypothetical protein
MSEEIIININPSASDNIVIDATSPAPENIQVTPILSDVASVNGKTGVVILNKSDIGLDQVDNTSDWLKPISFATLTALQSLSNYTNQYFLPLSGGTVSGPIRVNNNLTVLGNLTAFNTVLNTTTLTPIATLSSTNFIISRTLQDKLGESISVKDFGAKGDGISDDWLAIQRTLSAAAGIAKIYIPKGLYFISQELKVPSNSYIYGAGIGTTIIKLSASANASQCVMTNNQNTRSVTTNQGNENIIIKDLELDGNVSRFSGSYNPIGDSSGTGLCLAYVKNALIERVAVHDTCRHCFDISAPETSITFNPLDYVPNPSFNVHLKDIIAYGAGDDNITTHFSHNIIIENAYVPYTGGTEVPTNSNGIEIDDGSYDITIIGGYIKNCRRGLEIKGHSWAPAAKRVKVYGLTVENCVRNFGIRHLGFDSTDSKTAFDVALYDCTSIAPVSSIYTSDTPRSLQISNYDGVFVKDFKVVGEHNASRAVTIQERARNVNIEGMTFTQLSGSITGITDAMLFIDSTASRNITVRNAIFRDCVGLPIAATGSVPGIIIDGVDAKTSLSAYTPQRVIDFSWSPLDTPYIIRNVTMFGYLSAYQLGGSHNFDYPTTIDIGSITNIVPSSPALANTQYTVARFGWREGTGQSLNTGVGTKIEFTGSLISGVSANTDIPIAYIGTRKVNGTDSDVTSNLTFGTLSDNSSTVADRMSITPIGNVGINTTTPNERLTVVGTISTSNHGNSQLWNNSYNTSTIYQYNSSSYATTSYVNNNFFYLSGGTISGNVRINNNLSVFGNLTATGTTTFANTIFSTTSSLSVFHVGSGPALWVGNSGTGDIASFYDIDQNIEILHVGGNNGDFPNVGIKTSNPNKTFTVNGEISANNTIYDSTGNSNQWNSVYTNVQSNSANYQSVYSNVNTTSGNWNSVYTNVQSNSAKWEINNLDGGSSLSVYLGYQTINGGTSNTF